jgi:hypothetical protein
MKEKGLDVEVNGGEVECEGCICYWNRLKNGWLGMRVGILRRDRKIRVGLRTLTRERVGRRYFEAEFNLHLYSYSLTNSFYHLYPVSHPMHHSRGPNPGFRLLNVKLIQES